MDTSDAFQRRESIAILGFDPQNKVYRSWWFNSDGNRNTSTGSWNEQSQTLSYVTDLDDGKKIRSSVRFADPNQEVWEFKVTDADGKVYLDMEITATRQAAARDNGTKSDDKKPKPTDQSRLQGTWGAVAYVQNGQGGDEPIAPEDSAIKFVFKGDQFTLLASGNAGETPKGSFKLGSSGKAKTIDLIFPPESNGAKGQTMSGVYEFDGETLKITYAPNGADRLQTNQGITPMVEKSKANRFGLTPAWYGTASLVAACLSWASVWLVFNMGPDGILNNRLFEAVAIGLLPLFGFVCGLVGVGVGIHRRKWLGIITGAIGLAMIGLRSMVPRDESVNLGNLDCEEARVTKSNSFTPITIEESPMNSPTARPRSLATKASWASLGLAVGCVCAFVVFEVIDETIGFAHKVRSVEC